MRCSAHGPSLILSEDSNLDAAVTNSPSDSLEIREKKWAHGSWRIVTDTSDTRLSTFELGLVVDACGDLGFLETFRGVQVHVNQVDRPHLNIHNDIPTTLTHSYNHATHLTLIAPPGPPSDTRIDSPNTPLSNPNPSFPRRL